MPKFKLLLLALLCAGLLPATANAAPTYGLAIAHVGANRTVIDRNLDLARSVGVKVVRTELQWNRLEPMRAGQLDAGTLDSLDYIVAGASRRGLKVQVLVQGSPCWVSTAPAADRAGCTANSQSSLYAPWPPSDNAQFARITAFVAARYAPNLSSIELWNEPDQSNQNYFKGSDKTQRYAALVKAAYPAIKAAAPDVPVLAGALVGYNGAFLQKLYDEGMKGFYDGLAVHYYDQTLASLRAIHAVQGRNGDTAPLWLNEFGWSSCAPQKFQDGQRCVTEKASARNLSDMVRALRRTSWVAAAMVYTAEDNSYDLGLVRSNGRTRKPTYYSLRQQMRKTNTPRKVSLRLRRTRGGTIIASGGGPAADVYELRGYVGGTLRYKAQFFLDTHNEFRIKIPRVLGPHVTVRVKHLWTKRSAKRRI